MMHEYIEKIFERADIQQIREFLISGLDLIDSPDKRSYGKRLEENSINIIKRLENTAADADDLDETFGYFGDATETCKEVFLEIGMKVGARLLFQLLCED